MAKLPCPPELWPAFSALLDEALDRPQTERAEWLKSLGTEHAAVKPWLVKVLSNPGRTLEESLLNGPSLDATGPGEPPDTEFSIGQQVGPYRLARRLGSGGMGEVWLASRSDGTLNRQVALKLPHLHLMAGVLRRRFERERDILAGLSHPHIAQLYDAGVANSLHPYLAMEWVDGIAINDHCRQQRLALNGRLDLFLQILDAVGYAHERLVAHRDLKPSNILVTRDGQIKLLDFGIAKLLVDDTDTGATQLTRVGGCMATPAYAAPEQLAGQPITASVDLYALGVILYELLTGERPEREKRGPRSLPSDAGRASSRIKAGHAEECGESNTKQLRRALGGDLDAIIAKALETEPAMRYRTAEAFAHDIELSRQHRPISALHISPATLTLKFVRRHWFGVGMTTGLLLALLAGSVGIAWQAVRVEREAQRATTIKDFLVGVFRASDPRIAADKPRGEITARELLDVSTQNIEGAFASQPATQLELLGVTADIYQELGETQRSTALYAQEAKLAARSGKAADAQAIESLLGLASNADHDGDDVHALSLLARADPLIRQAHLEKSSVRARWLLMRGEALYPDVSKTAEARASLEAAAALFQAVAPVDPYYPDALTDLGGLDVDRSRFAEAVDHFRRAIEVAKNIPQLEGHLLLMYQGLAVALEYDGNFADAATTFEQGTQIALRTYGKNTDQYWAIASDWAEFRYERGEREAALAEFESLATLLPAQKAGFRNASEALEAALVLRKFGRCLAEDGQGARALAILERAQVFLVDSPLHPTDAATMQIDLGSAYEATGRTADARTAFQNAVNMRESEGAPTWELEYVKERHAKFLLAQNNLQQAETEFNAVLKLANGEHSASAVSARAGLAAISVSQGDVKAALEHSAAALGSLERVRGYYDVRLQPYVWSIRAQALMLAGDGDGAVALFRRSRDAALRYFNPASVQIARSDMLLRASENAASASLR